MDTPSDVEPLTGNELFCFMDSSRPCKPDCMAFLPVRPEGDDYNQPFAACSVLVNLHRLGKHHVAIAGQGAAFLRHAKVRAADAVRNGQPPPPKGG